MISQDPISEQPIPSTPAGAQTRRPFKESSSNIGALANSVSGIVREYPGPSVLIGAGLAWMFVSRESRKSQPLPRRLQERASVGKEHLMESASEARDSLRDAAHHAKEQTMDRLGDAKHSAEERLDQARTSLHERAESARSTLHDGAEKTREVYQSLLEENPLLLAAVAAALGLSIGMLLPATEPEDRVLGPTRDGLLDQARAIVDNARQAAVESLRFGAENVKAHLEEAANEAKATLSDTFETAKEAVKEELEHPTESPSQGSQAAEMPRSDRARPDTIV